MSDEKPTPQPESTPEPEEKTPETNGGQTPETEAPKPELSEEEKAAKIAAAKAKAAEKAAAKADEPPKMPWEEKPVPPEHEDAEDDEDAVSLKGGVPNLVLSTDRFANEVTITVPADRILEVCQWLKRDCDYKFLVDLTAVDWVEREDGRFDVIYFMHRFEDSKRLRVRAILAEDEAIDSVTEVWKVANWMEREVYDLFGIIFENHPGLERILTWEGFNGHPLLKDFPVEGIDTGAAIYPDVYPPGGGPVIEEEEGGAE